MSVLALIPTPGYPALPHVVGNLIYEGTYDDPAGDSVPSRVFQYAADGTLLHSGTVQAQDLSQPHGVQVAANDAEGRPLLLDKTSGRIIRLDPQTGERSLYSQVPQLPTCSTPRCSTWPRRPTTPPGVRPAAAVPPTSGWPTAGRTAGRSGPRASP